MFINLIIKTNNENILIFKKRIVKKRKRYRNLKLNKNIYIKYIEAVNISVFFCTYTYLQLFKA